MRLYNLYGHGRLACQREAGILATSLSSLLLVLAAISLLVVTIPCRPVAFWRGISGPAELSYLCSSRHFPQKNYSCILNRFVPARHTVFTFPRSCINSSNIPNCACQVSFVKGSAVVSGGMTTSRAGVEVGLLCRTLCTEDVRVLCVG